MEHVFHMKNYTESSKNLTEGRDYVFELEVSKNCKLQIDGNELRLLKYNYFYSENIHI